jgi:plastocyanin
MRLNAPCGLAVIAAFVLAGCGEQRAASPLSPSVLSERSPQNTQRISGTLAPRRVDNDGDGYDDGDGYPPPDPGTGPAPDPNQPPPEGTPGPVQLTINVVGTFGSGAFNPNPLQAAIGNTIVWMNNDFVTHDIVLDDGTPIGNLAPGQSSMPITLNTETAGYHCTFHPSMVGQVTTVPPPAAPPTDPSADPPTDPPPPPPYDPNGDDGYGDDDYYLKTPR